MTIKTRLEQFYHHLTHGF
ncbi:hypothetical protein CGLO_13141 [Colletotrichum gloeosporioides Cg-14]|uniref:Uncharacterized protein n=1 Tax=Colletotrichum gloeosporioides (strain Cg-14) TaxID=1237896 RepID=T0L7T4_COLGC|nr:hypothetical protein CGLO_13141 [Colletotrichum gloeosporioides Cg-14]